LFVQDVNASELSHEGYRRIELQHGRFRDTFYVGIKFLKKCKKNNVDDPNIPLFIFTILRSRFGNTFTEKTKKEFENWLNEQEVNCLNDKNT
jgi:hypothetical protein